MRGGEKKKVRGLEDQKSEVRGQKYLGMDGRESQITINE